MGVRVHFAVSHVVYRTIFNNPKSLTLTITITLGGGWETAKWKSQIWVHVPSHETVKHYGAILCNLRLRPLNKMRFLFTWN